MGRGDFFITEVRSYERLFVEILCVFSCLILEYFPVYTFQAPHSWLILQFHVDEVVGLVSMDLVKSFIFWLVNAWELFHALWIHHFGFLKLCVGALISLDVFKQIYHEKWACGSLFMYLSLSLWWFLSLFPPDVLLFSISSANKFFLYS